MGQWRTREEPKKEAGSGKKGGEDEERWKRKARNVEDDAGKDEEDHVEDRGGRGRG